MRTTPAANRLATLDLLRVFAALAVVAFHYLFRGADGTPLVDPLYPEAAPFAVYGYLGVNLFFLISGFVIAWSAEGRDGVSFGIARFARIYPGFVACLLITFLVLLTAGKPGLPASLPQFGANLFILAPALGQPFMDGVYWSIVLELIFYFWVAMALLLGVFERWKLRLVAGWLTVCVLNEFMLGSGALRLALVTEFGPWFAGGIMLQHIHSRGFSLPAALVLAASFLLSFAMLPVTAGWMSTHYGIAVPAAGLVIANIVVHGLLVAALLLNYRVTATPLLVMAGALTYPLYLLHQNIGYVSIARLEPLVGRWPAVALALGFVLVASWCVWRFVEGPLRRPLARLLARLVTLPGRGRCLPPHAADRQTPNRSPSPTRLTGQAAPGIAVPSGSPSLAPSCRPDAWRCGSCRRGTAASPAAPS